MSQTVSSSVLPGCIFLRLTSEGVADFVVAISPQTHNLCSESQPLSAAQSMHHMALLFTLSQISLSKDGT